MAAAPQLSAFLRLVADSLTSNATHSVARQGTEHLVAAIVDPLRMLPHEPSSIDAVDSLASLPDHPLTDAVRELNPTLPWIPSHRVDDGGAHTGLVLLDHVVDLSPVIAGLTVLDANSVYPEHNHPPAEVYLILGGTAEWRYGGSKEFVTHTTGDVVQNNPNDWHEIRTGPEPTVAIWVLWSTF